MNEKLRKFLEAIESNEELREKIMEMEKQNARKAMKKVIDLAAEYGCKLTEEDFELETEDELSEEDLKAISGGLGPMLLRGVSMEPIAKALS